jgi:hypothetical protein
MVERQKCPREDSKEERMFEGPPSFMIVCDESMGN